TGTVSGKKFVGGVVGVNAGVVQNCYNTGTINGTITSGGVVGYNDGGTVKNCFNTGTVTCVERVGGVVGNTTGTVENCYNTATVSGETIVGGIIGYQGENSLVENCASLGSKILYFGGSTADFGRVVGYHNMGTINNNKSRSDMLVNNAIVTGGAANDINGADVTVGDGTTQASVFGGWNSSVWTIPVSNLVAGETLPTLTVFSGKQTPTLPTVVKEGPKPLDDKITTLEPGNIYTVADSEQLARLASLSYVKWVSGYTVKLLNDIELSTIDNWAPIGSFSNNFAGIFDGCGFEVKNLKVSNNAVDYQGLFGYVASDGIVQNVGVTGTVSGKENVGGVVGRNKGGI
ncbi:MAG: GLUG motif-containing protein, partial [Oscillospiraceae bacterium]